MDYSKAKELLKGNPLEVVIGTGFDGGLKLNPDAEALLKQRTALLVLTSPQAVEKINEMLAKDEKISALIHVTCWTKAIFLS